MRLNFTIYTMALLLIAGSLSAQNVGIGTLAPTEKLHVEGTLRVTSLSGAGNGVVMTNATGVVSRTTLSGSGTDVFTGLGTFVPMSSFLDGWKLLGNTGTNPATNFLGTIDAQDFVIRTTNLERLRVAAGGNVGIGTAAPTGRLHVANADGSRMIYGTTGNLSVYDAETFVGEVRLGSAWNRPGVYSSQQLELFSDATGIIFGDSDVERMRMTAAGSFGIGIAAPTQRLDVQGGNARINNAFIGDVGHGAPWAAWSNSSQNTTVGYGLLQSSDGLYTFINKLNTGSGYIGFRQSNIDMAVIDFRGNMGIGTTTPAANARLQVIGGAIMPAVGNNNASGIYFPVNPGGGGGDEAYIRYYVEAGENTKLVIANQNDADDDIDLQTGGVSRLNIDGDGSIRIDKGVLFDCNNCGDVNTIDGAANWGDLVVQGRVLSTNSNLHLSPPGGNRVIINSAYRAAGGGTGTTGLDIEDGGIRMRKNYRYFQRYGYVNSANGWDSSQTHNLGNWDFCAVAQFGFKNNQSVSDEDDDVQCAVYPNAAFIGEQQNDDYYFTEQFNSRRTWFMYFEAYEDTNGVTCAASCINLD